MADGFLNQFLAKGTAALRAAFTPSAPSVISGTPDQAYTWYETDTKRLKAYGAAWEEPNPGLSNVISPAQITANQNDYNPTGLAGSSVLRLSTDASRDVTGLQGGVEGRVIVIENVGSFGLVLKDESASSSAANRFALDADLTLSGEMSAILRYDATSSRWRLSAVGRAADASVTFASTTEQLTGTETAKASTPDSVAALWEQGSDVASAGTISLGEGGYFNVTGTTTITDIDFATDKAGRKAWVKFAGVLTLTHNASTLILPTGANITTAAGDTACFVSEGSDVVRCVAYQRASGAPLVAGSLTSGDVTTALGYTPLKAGKVSYPVAAAAMIARTTNGAATGTSESTTNKVMTATLDFDQSTDEFAQFTIAMPKNWDEGTVTAQFYWTAGSTGNVIWGLQGVALSDDDAIDTAFGTAQTVTDGVTAAGDLMISAETSAITIAGTPAAGDLVVFQVYRDADNGSDTLAADAKLIQVKLFITLNAEDEA